MSKIKHGIVLYTIESDTCLNGVYTNERTRVPGTIYNEIAKKFQNGLTAPNIVGIYKCVYFDENGTDFSREEVLLTISLQSGNWYKFVWSSNNIDKFRGDGYVMNNGQIVVHYTSV